MKTKTLLFIIFIALFSSSVSAQFNSYSTVGSETIFSFADIEKNNVSADNIIRFSPVFNLQVYGHFNFGKHFGLLTGGAIRNVGFINGNVDAENSGIKKK